MRVLARFQSIVTSPVTTTTFVAFFVFAMACTFLLLLPARRIRLRLGTPWTAGTSVRAVLWICVTVEMRYSPAWRWGILRPGGGGVKKPQLRGAKCPIAK